MNDLISRKALLAEYDRVHIGEPGKARKLMEDAPAVREWIPVSERLPKYNTFVIVFAEGIVGEAVLDDANYWYWAGTDEDASEIYVTHWMPLPEPPEE